jgi:mono/diheme cytochrome c family protein
LPEAGLARYNKSMFRVHFMASVVLLLTLAAAAAASRSVWDGVYSAPQASRGESAYNSKCARCHGEALLGGENSPALVDQDFLEKWNGRPVGSLVELMRKTMPSDGPGKLTRQQCTDIAAYVLSANGFPAGKSELAPDAAVQDEIVFKSQK